jgi:hypothetical protein
VGGRVQYKNGADWAVSDDPARLATTGIENTAQVFDLAERRWRTLNVAPPEGRAGAAAVVRDGKVYFLGGDEQVRLTSRRLVIQESQQVDIFDLASETFARSEQPLPKGIAYSRAIVNSEGEIELFGGITYRDTGRRADESSFHAVLGERGWVLEPMQHIGVAPALIPHSENTWITGPFRDPDSGAASFSMLAPREV